MKRYEFLTDTLRRKVSTLPTGSKLPSIRSLMKRYSLSLHSVNAALQILEKEALVIRRRGSGIYTQKKSKIPLIEIHLTAYTEGGFNVKEFSVTHALAAEGWTFRIHRHDPTFDDPTDVPDPGAVAHLIKAEFANNQRTFFNLIRQLQTPLILLDRQPELDFDMISSNDYEVFGLLVRHLSDLGHRRFAFLVNEPDGPDIRQRRRAFAEVLSIFGYPPALFIECETRLGDISSLSAYDAMLRVAGAARGKRLPFTAIISTSPSGAYGAIRALHDTEFVVPQDCSVASFGLDPASVLSIPSLTEAGNPHEEWGREAVKLLKRRFSGEKGKPIQIDLPVRLNVRESTGPAIATESSL